MTEKTPTNIEDTIFTDYLPVNGYPMVTRLKELMDENLKEHKDWKKDKRIEQLLWLILVTFTNNQIVCISMDDWWRQLSAQHKTETTTQT